MSNHQMRPNQDSAAFALVLGFVPAAVFLIAAAMGIQDLSENLRRVILLVICMGSVGCCFFSSIILFKRNTASSIVGGIVLLILNVLISLFLGCAAMMQ